MGKPLANLLELNPKQISFLVLLEFNSVFFHFFVERSP